MPLTVRLEAPSSSALRRRRRVRGPRTSLHAACHAGAQPVPPPSFYFLCPPPSLRAGEELTQHRPPRPTKPAHLRPPAVARPGRQAGRAEAAAAALCQRRARRQRAAVAGAGHGGGRQRVPRVRQLLAAAGARACGAGGGGNGRGDALHHGRRGRDALGRAARIGLRRNALALVGRQAAAERRTAAGGGTSPHWRPRQAGRQLRCRARIAAGAGGADARPHAAAAGAHSRGSVPAAHRAAAALNFDGCCGHAAAVCRRSGRLWRRCLGLGRQLVAAGGGGGGGGGGAAAARCQLCRRRQRRQQRRRRCGSAPLAALPQPTRASEHGGGTYAALAAPRCAAERGRRREGRFRLGGPARRPRPLACVATFRGA